MTDETIYSVPHVFIKTYQTWKSLYHVRLGCKEDAVFLNWYQIPPLFIDYLIPASFVVWSSSIQM